MHRILIVLIALLALPSLAFTQTPKTGMSNGAFTFALSGQLADEVTTEVALWRGLHEGNTLMRHRAVRLPLKIALPFVARWAAKSMPRTDANVLGVIVGAWGFGPAGWNVYVTIKGK